MRVVSLWTWNVIMDAFQYEFSGRVYGSERAFWASVTDQISNQMLGICRIIGIGIEAQAEIIQDMSFIKLGVTHVTFSLLD